MLHLTSTEEIASVGSALTQCGIYTLDRKTVTDRIKLADCPACRASWDAWVEATAPVTTSECPACGLYFEHAAPATYCPTCN